ncbi:hypothetical protein G5B40_11405 [Pikeienuella piscinae]|uniref:Agarase n=1 Tax=Pikeienuella piscinae TaxID=2748098 RepID=A0A7L5BVW5_9RHOB|nr:hypothetical protein [Pikeienuella piscinae]QIE56005.1 hypothetical protein G5B40_11405 [Pikeienuella piscinae]
MNSQDGGSVALDRDGFGGSRKLSSHATGFFRIEKLADRWWFLTPEGNVFFSLGLNHISSCAFRRPDGISDFLSNYGGDEGWIRNGVARDLRSWGFNSIGWTQEIAQRYAPRDPLKRNDVPDPRRGWGDRFALLHDRPWEHERYQWAGMPYCHSLNFVNNAYYYDGSITGLGESMHYPDVFDPYFQDHCDHIARTYAGSMRDDPNLIGYFFSDVPDWSGEVHSRHWTRSVDGAYFNDADARIAAIAKYYFETTAGAIRRYDSNHLLLGDRFLGGRALPGSVLDAMRNQVDVLSVQSGGNFSEERAQLAEWRSRCGKPILLCDAVMPPQYFGPPQQKNRGEAYTRYLRAALTTDSVIGVHFCGAYAHAEARGWGIKSASDEADPELIDAFMTIHADAYDIALDRERIERL